MHREMWPSNGLIEQSNSLSYIADDCCDLEEHRDDALNLLEGLKCQACPASICEMPRVNLLIMI